MPDHRVLRHLEPESAGLKALDEVGYNGWATAEVAGGGEKELRDVAERMNRILGLT